jgi:GR25 family glycosyltransferase involved in LPS biosynthesis
MSNNSYVIHLEGDNARSQRWFTNQQRINQTDPMFRMFPATHGRNSTLRNEYPFLKWSYSLKKFGDVGCTESHVRLLKQLIAERQNSTDGWEYYFIFEDDALIGEKLIRQRQVQAPSDADAVFLIHSWTKAVPVPYQNKQNFSSSSSSTAIRVIQSYGGFGYVITVKGALKVLQHLKRYAVPIDLAMYQARTMRMYCPLGTQNKQDCLVKHQPGQAGSSKHHINNKGHEYR